MHTPDILLPVLALASWTGLFLLLVPIARFRAAFRREVSADDFKFGESPSVPSSVSIPNRNYMNLLEAPMLFYVACVLLFVTAAETSIGPALAWTYVGLRMLHSVIYLTYNRVMHRLPAFAVSNVVLVALWVVAGIHIVAVPAA
jgi:hypothetical protein